MALDVVTLSRAQFAFTIIFHIIFPSFSIGLATFLAIMEGKWLKTKNIAYLNICKFWTKIFALTFGMGVVSGIVMEFQLGTNWSGYAASVGGVLGALFTYEVLTAFFIEAGFLGVMLFGWDKVGKELHYVATLLVCIGTIVSAFWILAANSWMQTPDGVTFENGKFLVHDWYSVVFNHSMLSRFFHMIVAAWMTTAFVIAGISAYYLLKNRHIDFAKKCFSMVMGAVIILTPIQVLIGDEVGWRIHEYQPLKTAAMEGVWDTQQAAPLLLFAIPDQEHQRNRLAFGIPYGASLLNTHSLNGELIGLKSVSVEDQPWAIVVFWSFRIMVGLGFIMLLVATLGVWFRVRKNLYSKRWFLKLCVLTTPAGFIAIIAGWITAEVGRQPWIVYNFLRTIPSASPVSFWHVLMTFALMMVVYGIIFGIFYFYYLGKIIDKGPDGEKPEMADEAFAYAVGGVQRGENQ